jgi:hypothetical protein
MPSHSGLPDEAVDRRARNLAREDGRAWLLLTEAQRENYRRRADTCRCGHRLEDCSPERCSHSFARDAMWGNS